MDVENQGEGRSLSAIATSCNSMCLDIDAQSIAAKEMYTTGDENEPKARKPYTITKQRERWTEDEHKKFLEALKLYGRAWRRIEEHVGTKTAVQIRSHAQKFFSKVVRESSNTEASPVKAIEIPPPRPKRKPMHPYPRKQVQTVDRRIAVPQQLERSPSPNSPVSEQENQSPKSVGSAVGSDTLGSTVSNLQNGSQSPVSSADYAKPSSLLTSRKDDRCCQASTSLTDEENGSPSTFATSGSSAQEQSSMTCDFGSKDKGSKEESQSVEAPTTMSLKLFGRTVLVTDSLRPSSSLTGTAGKALAAEGNQESLVTDKPGPVHSVQKNPMDSVYSMASNINTWNSWPYGNPSTLYQTQFRNENPKQAVEGSSVVPMPWWSMQGGLPFPVLTPLKVDAVQMPSNAHCSEPSEEESDDQDKEGSSTGSSTSSDDVADTNNQELSSDKNPSQGYVLKPSKRSAFSPLTANPSKCIKGFVPYKRCLAEREDKISKIAGEERDGQRVRLCL